MQDAEVSDVVDAATGVDVVVTVEGAAVAVDVRTMTRRNGEDQTSGSGRLRGGSWLT